MNNDLNKDICRAVQKKDLIAILLISTGDYIKGVAEFLDEDKKEIVISNETGLLAIPISDIARISPILRIRLQGVVE